MTTGTDTRMQTSRAEARRKRILNCFQTAILILSVLLIVFISYDTFKNIPFLANRSYMLFQLFTCLVFITDFFVELKLTPHGGKAAYIKSRWFFLIISIPYLNIIDILNIGMSAGMLYFARFLPLVRGALALAIVLNYIAANKITGIFVSYLSILLLTVYFAGLIFYNRESPINPGVTSYWEAFWWCGMQATTLGCSLSPVTVAGKLLAVILSLMGTIMFPLFTVYLSSLILKSRKVLNIINIAGSKVKIADSSRSQPSDMMKKVGDKPEKS